MLTTDWTDPGIRTMDDWRLASRATYRAKEAVGREIARQRDAGASDAVLLALDEALRAVPFPAVPQAQPAPAVAPNMLDEIAANNAADDRMRRGDDCYGPLPEGAPDTAEILTPIQHAYRNLVQDVQGAIDAWPQFDGGDDISVSGADLVDWFDGWRIQARHTLTAIKSHGPAVPVPATTWAAVQTLMRALADLKADLARDEPGCDDRAVWSSYEAARSAIGEG